MSRRFTSGSLLALAMAGTASIACGDGLSVERTPYAVAVFACGPADGPAVQIYLAEQPITNGAPLAPFVSLFFDRSIQQLTAGTYTTSSSTAPVAISRLSSPIQSSFEVAQNGFVHITSVLANHTVIGDVTAEFSNDVISREFVAPWQDRQVPCV